MQLLNKNTDYAIRALLQAASAGGEYVSSSKIAIEEDIPLHFVRRILQELVKAGYLLSREGSGGGVKLNKAPDKITIREILNLFQGDIQITSCMFRRKICSKRATCVLRKRIQGIERKVIEEFSAFTIQDLLNDMGV